jgi:hypothetical protein
VSFLVVDARVDVSVARNRVWQQLASEAKDAEPPFSLHLSARARDSSIHPSSSSKERHDSPIFSFPFTSYALIVRALYLDVVYAQWHEILC